VYKVVDANSGEYKVKYSGNFLTAYASDPSIAYSVDDTVYVTVPEGDFSNRKIITSKTSDSSLSYAEMMTLANSINEVSPTFDTIYDYDKTAEAGVVAGADLDSELGHYTIY
jgi:hypothetical protein